MVKKVLLMSLPAVQEVGDDYLQDGHSFHLGLVYLAAVLRESGLYVKVLDCFAEDRQHLRAATPPAWQEFGLADDRILAAVEAAAPDLIGMTVPFSCQHYVAHAIARLIKARYPQVPIVAGGNHVSAAPEQMDRTLFDYLVLGEGEEAFLELINTLNAGQAVGAGAARAIPQSLSAPPVEALDRLPFPAIDLLPLDKLWSAGRRWIIMVASRGCPYDCNFCSIHTIMGRRIRRRSIDHILAEIAHWVKTYRVQEIFFEDDNLTVDMAWAKELFRQIARRRWGLRLYARNGIRADAIDTELLLRMKQAGFQDFMIAPESGSQKTLDQVIGKKMQMEDCVRAVQLAHEANLGVNLFFVIGLPGETWDDIHATLRYAHRLKALGGRGVWISLASPYPGTRLYEQCRQENLLAPDFDYRRCRTVDYQVLSPNYTAAELKAFRTQAMAELNPPRTRAQVAGDAVSLLLKDPAFFLSKLRYKLRR